MSNEQFVWVPPSRRAEATHDFRSWLAFESQCPGGRGGLLPFWWRLTMEGFQLSYWFSRGTTLTTLYSTFGLFDGETLVVGAVDRLSWESELVHPKILLTPADGREPVAFDSWEVPESFHRGEPDGSPAENREVPWVESLLSIITTAGAMTWNEALAAWGELHPGEERPPTDQDDFVMRFLRMSRLPVAEQETGPVPPAWKDDAYWWTGPGAEDRRLDGPKPLRPCM